MSRITDYAALSAPDPADVLPVVDVSDTSMSAQGTTKQVTVGTLDTRYGILVSPLVSVITATNASWPIPSGAGYLEIIAVGGGGQGGGGGSMGGSTLTSALTSGNPYTSLAVTALPVAVTSGQSVTLVSGASTQTFVASATAAINATSITVTSQNANFSYPASGGTAVIGNSWSMQGGGGGAAGNASQQIVPVGANTTLNVTIGTGGTGAGGGAGVSTTTGTAGTAGAAGNNTTVTGTGISVLGHGGFQGGGSAAAGTGGGGGVFGLLQLAIANYGPGGGGFALTGGAPQGYSSGGGGPGGTAIYASGAGKGGNAGTAIAGGTPNSGGLGAGVLNGTDGAAAAASTGAGGGAGGAGFIGGTGGNGGAGGSGFAIIRVIG